MKSHPVPLIEFLEPRIQMSVGNVIGASGLLQTTTTLPQPRASMVATTVGNKAIFGGGYFAEGAIMPMSAFVYDAATGQWTTDTLQSFRDPTTATAVGGKVFFAGGYLDIYDVTSRKWSAAQLSQSRNRVAAASVNDLAIFVAVDQKSPASADIFSATTGHWSTVPIPLPVNSNRSARLGSKAIFFAANDKYTLEVFDGTSGTWSTIAAPTGLFLGGNSPMVSVGSKLFLLGASSASQTDDTIAMYDDVTGRWSTHLLSQARDGAAVSAVGTKAIFAGGYSSGSNFADSSVVDIYDTLTDSWYTASLSTPRSKLTGASAGNQAIFVGGGAPPIGTTNAVDIFTDTTPAPVLSGSITSRAKGKLSVTITNTGDAPLSGPYTINLYATPPHRLKGAVLVGNATIQRYLAAGASARITTTITLPNGLPPGTYHLVAALANPDGSTTPFAAQSQSFTIVTAHRATSHAIRYGHTG